MDINILNVKKEQVRCSDLKKLNLDTKFKQDFSKDILEMKSFIWQKLYTINLDKLNDNPKHKFRKNKQGINWEEEKYIFSTIHKLMLKH